MARLLGVSTADVQRDRIETVREFARAWGVHLVLKGATSVIGDPEGRVVLNPTGNPGMATGGTGDVLTGVIAALCCRLEPFDAAICGAFLHATAGEQWSALVGADRGLLAHEIADRVPAALADLSAEGGLLPV